MSLMQTTPTKCKCSKCDGRGTLSWTNLANGVCFQCDGAGVLLVTIEEIDARRLPRAEAISRIAQFLSDFAACDLASWHHESGDRNGWACILFAAYALAYAPDDVGARGLAAISKALYRANSSASDQGSAQAYLEHYVRHYAAELVAGSRKVARNVRKVA